MPTLREAVDAELIRAIVGRTITCPRSGELLDARTCVVIRDDDQDPAAVLSQAGFASATPAEISDWRAHGLYVDTTTVRLTTGKRRKVHHGTCSVHADIHGFQDSCIGWHDYPITAEDDYANQEV